MTQDEIDTMWQQAMRQSIEDGEMFTRYHFAKLIATKEREALAQPPRPMQECPNYEDCKGACFQCEYFNAETGTVEYPPQNTEPVFCEYCGGNDENPPDHCMDCASPQRTWVGLTDEEFYYLRDNSFGVSPLISAVEAKLKQKNGYTEEKNT